MDDDGLANTDRLTQQSTNDVSSRPALKHRENAEEYECPNRQVLDLVQCTSDRGPLEPDRNGQSENERNGCDNSPRATT